MLDKSVTPPWEARSGPVLAPLETEMDWSAMITPIIVAPVLMVADDPTFHHTFTVSDGELSIMTEAPMLTVRVLLIWKIHIALVSF